MSEKKITRDQAMEALERFKQSGYQIEEMDCNDDICTMIAYAAQSLAADSDEPSRAVEGLSSHRPQAEIDAHADQVYSEIWKDIVENADGSLNVEAVKGELYDYSVLMDNAGKVYQEITGNRISKLNTTAEAVIGEHDSQLQRWIDEAVEDAKKEWEDERAADPSEDRCAECERLRKAPNSEVSRLEEAKDQAEAEVERLQFDLEQEKAERDRLRESEFEALEHLARMQSSHARLEARLAEARRVMVEVATDLPPLRRDAENAASTSEPAAEEAKPEMVSVPLWELETTLNRIKNTCSSDFADSQYVRALQRCLEAALGKDSA